MPAARALDLPEPSLGNLLEIEKILTAITRTVWGRDQLTQYILNNEFLQRLLPLLDVCEDLDNIEDLYTLSSIVRMLGKIILGRKLIEGGINSFHNILLVLLNDTTIYEYILREEIYVQVIGILECKNEVDWCDLFLPTFHLTT